MPDSTTSAATPQQTPQQQGDQQDEQSQSLPHASKQPKQPSPAIPVGLQEAGLDSPTFRSTAVHFAEQIDVIEKWLDDYVKSTTKVTREILALEETINSYLSKSVPPAIAADAVIDHDYTLLALRRASEGSREWWTQVLSTMRKMDSISAEPVRAFLNGEMKSFKEVRRALDQTQRHFDQVLGRYASQPKNKEPSSLREDAFAVYEARKAYLTASMDFCQLAPQLRYSLDKLLVRVASEVWKEVKRAREAGTSAAKWGGEMDRIKGWSKEMASTEGVFRKELQRARRDIGTGTLTNAKPSRELEDYSASTVPFLGSRGPINVQTNDKDELVSEKQGWLFLKSIAGKPARTAWVRRWYYLRDGIFGWLIQGPQGVLQGDEIGVLLCSAKPAVAEDRRFCFEIKTKSQTMVLQVETQTELSDWLEVFEGAKKKAFEVTIDREPLPSGYDPAFQITPPPVPEFSAKLLDTQLSHDDHSGTLDRAGTLPIPGQDLTARQSMDVNAANQRGSIRALGRDLGRDLVREEGESGREHAARIISKLDLHRKATFGTEQDGRGGNSPNVGGSGGGGGIASLISASHGLFPGYPASVMASAKASQSSVFPSIDALQGTLAPGTLAKAPVPTSLSRTAVHVTGDKGLALDASSRLPAAVMANYWGSNPWSTLYGKGHISPRTPGQLEDNPFGVVATPVGKPGEEKMPSPQGHRKSVSVDTKASQPTVQPRQQVETFPRGYPNDLRAQHAQFRLIFPGVPLEEKLVLVFSASWTSSAGSENTTSEDGVLAGNGRIFITPDNMYFYGQQMGLTVIFTMSLDNITEVTAAPGKDCDFIFLHLRDDSNELGFSRINIKVFLENLNLLHARLNLLVDDLQAEEPMSLPEIVNALINLEHEDNTQRSPSVGSWEEISSSTPMDDGSVPPNQQHRQDVHGTPKVRVDRSALRAAPKFQLPVHPVIFEPDDMQRKVAERNFELSAKACFHVLFGDKSFVFPKLYFERRAQQIAQGPWLLGEQGHLAREFKFKVEYSDILGRHKAADVVDTQTIDVFEDHVTYVVTHTKRAWHLPHSSKFRVVSKIVITHVAKSKCKLAMYTRVDWSKRPTISGALVERQALEDAEGDSEDLADVATDQVRKLGPHSRTKRAIQVYGNIGQQTQVLVFSPAETADASKKQSIKQRTLTAMLLETVRSFGESALTSLIMWSFAGVRKLFSVASAHKILLFMLAMSSLLNFLWVSRESSSWWVERRAASFMNNVGVGPNLMMSKAVYVSDLNEAASGYGGQNMTWPEDSACYSAFQAVADANDMDAPFESAGATLSSSSGRSTAQRIRRTRQRLGSYRHDLLVAMRVVNSIEREMVHSEWENWLADETMRCDQLKMALDDDESGIGGADKKGKSSGATASLASTGEQKVLSDEDKAKATDRREKLKLWHEAYCGSCKMDQWALRSQRESTNGGMM